MKTIKSICVGNDAEATFYMTGEEHRGKSFFVDEIREEFKYIGAGLYNDLTLLVYRGYVHPDPDPVFEIESNNGLVIAF